VARGALLQVERAAKKNARHPGPPRLAPLEWFFCIPDKKRSVDMDIIISSLKVPYLRAPHYGTEQLSTPDGQTQTLSFSLGNEEMKLSSKRESSRLKKGGEAVEVLSYLVARGQMKKYLMAIV
jgi:hypothetical protein